MKIKFIALFVSLLGAEICVAQFNTVGTLESRTIVTTKKNPSEQVKVQKDSLAVETHVSASATDEIQEQKEIVRAYMSVSWPLKEIRVNSPFGMRLHPIYHRYIMHNGIDLHARHEDVLSILPGRVVRVGYDSRSGKFVTIQTGNYTISYCHLSQQYVHINESVKAGDAVGLSGQTGAATGEHLHLTTKKDGKAIDPTILLEYVRNVKRVCLEKLSR